VRNGARYSQRALDPAADSREQWEVLAELAGRLHGSDAAAVDELVLSHMLGTTVGGPETTCPDVSPEQARAALGDQRGPERIVDLLLRTGPKGDRFDDASDGLSLAKVRAHPHGIDLGPLEPRLPGVLDTATGSIELAPELLVADVERLAAELEERGRDDRVVLIGRRQLRSNNSWMHNIHALAKGKQRCTLLVHPDDARRFGLRDGGRARVRSRVGELEAPVVVSDEMRPGVVSLPHGFGHADAGVRLQVAQRQAGVNSNRLTDEDQIDVPSGNAVLNGIPVELQAAP
jgi:anaerobic selenocysteine-containing dehydrogenase